MIRIQNAADRTQTPISVVGSRASGSSGPLSDWDYVVPPGTSRRTIHSLSSSLPEGTEVSESQGIKIFIEAMLTPVCHTLLLTLGDRGG